LIRDPETFENTGFRVKPGMTIETVFGLFTIPSRLPRHASACA
jgi:hypothetical protein